jgi:hypothetical protein
VLDWCDSDANSITNTYGYGDAYGNANCHVDSADCDTDAYYYTNANCYRDASLLLEARFQRLYGRWWSNECC